MAAIIIPAILAAANASAGQWDFQSGEEQVSLLELYTSEGCSSCPPAEAWLGGMKDSPKLWKGVVPVGFHVDYWDYLGWRDPWAAKVYTDRQRAYAGSWNSGQVYTPGFVLNGREWLRWRASNDAPAQSGTKAGVLRATSADGHEWKITFKPAQDTGADYELHVALLGSGLRTDVRAGENSGRQLVHDFVAITLIDAPMQTRGENREAVVKLPGNAPGDSGKLALAVWITRAREIIPLQATGRWLAK